jgi:hypothetical protein
MSPPVVVFRSVFRGRVNFATTGWLLEQTPDHVVLGIVPGAQTAQMVGPREAGPARLAAGIEKLHEMPWHTQRRVWLMPFGVSHALGHFWDDATDEFVGYYINLQAPLCRSSIGFDSCDHVLDVVVDPDRSWQWKDEDELSFAVRLGLFCQQEAVAIRAEGDRVIATLPNLLPTGWEDWRPDPSWPLPQLPTNWRQVSGFVGSS